MICCTFIADIFSRKKYYEMSNVRGHGNINIESRMSQLIVKKYHRKLRHEVAAHRPLAQPAAQTGAQRNPTTVG